MDKDEVKRWIDTLADDSRICIDSGGLAIVEVNPDGDETGAYLEIGLTPADAEQA